MNVPAREPEAPAATPARRDRWILAGLVFYVATLGVFTVNDVFRLDLFEWEMFTPELHTWIYSLLHLLEDDPADPALYGSARQIERRLTRLRDVLARTRYARVVTPGSLEDRLSQYLGAGLLDPLPEAAARARAFLEEGQAEARRRLAEEIEDWATIPLFVKYLDSDNPRLRRETFALLKRVVDTYWSAPEHAAWKAENYFDYDPEAPRASRIESVKRWKAWMRTLDLP